MISEKNSLLPPSHSIFIHSLAQSASNKKVMQTITYL